MGMFVPINDLRRQNGPIAGLLVEAIKRVVDRGWYILGPEVEAFEREFAAYCSVGHCVGVGNGTDALELALRALGVGTGDLVATVANAGMYSTIAIEAVGARPLYVDVDRQRMTMSAEALAAALVPTVRAVIVTHLYGQMADMPRILSVASQAGIPVVEDCAQAHGARLDGKAAGAWGKIGCFSFYPTKNLGALGDGGAVVTNDASLAERVRCLRQYGWTSKYRASMVGGRNSRLDELQAAILRAKLPYLDEWNERRRNIARSYTEALSPLGLELPCGFGPDYVAHLYVIRTPHRDELRRKLALAGVGTDIHYPLPDHKQRTREQHGRDCPWLSETERCAEQVLSLPCFPQLTHEDVDYVVEAIRRASNT